MTIYAIKHPQTKEVLFIETSWCNSITMMKQRLSEITTNKELLVFIKKMKDENLEVIVEKLEEVNYSGVLKREESWKQKIKKCTKRSYC
jgi:hypothetical protein